MHKLSVMTILAALLWAPVTIGAQAAGPITVVSAQRGKAFSSPTRMFRPRDEAADVVIALHLVGLSREEFRAIDQDTIYIMAGAEKLPPTVVATGVIDGKPQMLIVTVGPKDMLTMKLFMGTYAPVTFTAETAIAEELTQ